MEEKVLGLDGKMYDKPVDVNVLPNTEAKQELPKIGMIMDAAKQGNTEGKETKKIDPKVLEQVMQYYNRQPSRREYKIGRNDLCPCNSGKKYKNCCLKTGKYEKLTKEKK